MSMTLQDESVTALLEQRPVVISVGGPWDFESADGPNRLEGKIVSVELGGGELGAEQAVILEVTPFVSKAGTTVTRLSATARYAEDGRDLVEKIANRQKVPANLSYAEEVPEERMPEGASPFLIGSVCLDLG